MQASLASVYSRVSQPRHYCYSGLDYLCMRVCVCDRGRQECCPVHYRMFSSIPSLYPLEASSALPTPIGVTSKNISGRFQMFLWGQNHPLVEKQWSRVNKKTIIWGSLNKWKKKKKEENCLKPGGQVYIFSPSQLRKIATTTQAMWVQILTHKDQNQLLVLQCWVLVKQMVRRTSLSLLLMVIKTTYNFRPIYMQAASQTSNIKLQDTLNTDPDKCCFKEEVLYL